MPFRKILLGVWLLQSAFAFSPKAVAISRLANAMEPKNYRSPLKIPRSKQDRSLVELSAARVFGGIEMANVFYDDIDTAFNAWEWTANIGAPAALVAGAVLVTLSETREDTSPQPTDQNWARLLKSSMRFLLLSSFALEVIAIFVSTMTGTVLLGGGGQIAKKAVGYQSPLQLLYHHHEFEYLTTQICFLQGLFHWLAAVAIDLALPKKSETKSAKRMNGALAGWLLSLMVWMMAFYNNHLRFYSDYAHMLYKFGLLFVRRYIITTPFRPLSLLYVPSFLVSSVLTWRAFNTKAEEDEDDDDDEVESNK